MADCTKTVEFIRELVRMCDSNAVCSSCPLRDAKRGTCGGTPAESLSEDAIAIVQKWSDEHPVMTWEGRLRELLQDARIIEEIMHICCPSDVFGSIAPTADEGGCKSMGGCTSCWNTEYKEAP